MSYLHSENIQFTITINCIEFICSHCSMFRYTQRCESIPDSR